MSDSEDLASSQISEQNKKQILAFSLDFDGCMDEIWKQRAGFQVQFKNLQLGNALYKWISELTGSTALEKAYICVGSTRQDFRTDQLNNQRYDNGSIFVNYPALVDHINTFSNSFISSEDSKNSSSNVELLTLLLSDFAHSKRFGFNFENVTSRSEVNLYESDPGEDDSNKDILNLNENQMDRNKLSILLAQIYHLAEKHPGDEITYRFVDDQSSILNTLLSTFQKHAHFLIPSNVTVEFYQYSDMGEKQDPVLKGTVQGSFDKTLSEKEYRPLIKTILNNPDLRRGLYESNLFEGLAALYKVDGPQVGENLISNKPLLASLVVLSELEKSSNKEENGKQEKDTLIDSALINQLKDSEYLCKAINGLEDIGLLTADVLKLLKKQDGNLLWHINHALAYLKKNRELTAGIRQLFHLSHGKKGREDAKRYLRSITKLETDIFKETINFLTGVDGYSATTISKPGSRNHFFIKKQESDIDENLSVQNVKKYEAVVQEKLSRKYVSHTLPAKTIVGILVTLSIVLVTGMIVASTGGGGLLVIGFILLAIKAKLAGMLGAIGISAGVAAKASIVVPALPGILPSIAYTMAARSKPRFKDNTIAMSPLPGNNSDSSQENSVASVKEEGKGELSSSSPTPSS